MALPTCINFETTVLDVVAVEALLVEQRIEWVQAESTPVYHASRVGHAITSTAVVSETVVLATDAVATHVSVDAIAIRITRQWLE